MRSIDIKLLLILGYTIGYPLAVVPPMIIDPRLTSHVEFSSRHYPDAIFCLPIFLSLAIFIIELFKVKSSLYTLYSSVVMYELVDHV